MNMKKILNFTQNYQVMKKYLTTEKMLDYYQIN